MDLRIMRTTMDGNSYIDNSTGALNPIRSLGSGANVQGHLQTMITWHFLGYVQ